ncbi:hypothetical protein D9758_001621 [Tetrapyrgos nigripes]|uniref:Uncharacterized protein n=1 Tax=Tetrapyrgos nigripes TaxID=182062 RepID=A0A8H5LXJ2_9AGAR|nr:hypothetical protein D9758_001621 [Tetrapyrgos nigripes]
MFSKIFTTVSLVLALSVHVNGHTLIAPALGVQGNGVRNDVQRPSAANACGNVNVAQTIDSSTPVAAAADGTFTATATDFNAGADGSRQVSATVDATGAGKTFNGKVTISQNGDAAPTAVGSQQIVAALPAGTKCTGGAAGNRCLVAFKTTAGFGNCVVVSQGGAAGTAAGTGAGAANTGAATGAANGNATTGAATSAANGNANAGAANAGAANAGAANAGAANAGAANAGNANAGAANAGAANAGAANAGAANAGATTGAANGNGKGKGRGRFGNGFGRVAGTRTARALLSELEARGEESLDVVKRNVLGSSLPPSYSVTPIDGESSLAHNRRVHHHGTYTRKCGNVSVTLTEQAGDAIMPVYPQRGVVSGTIHLGSCHHISEVLLKFQGRFKYSLSGYNASSRSIKTVDEKYVLWNLDISSQGTAPSSMPFSVIFPFTFKDGNDEAPLPPSYETSEALSGVSAKSEYKLKVIVKTSKTLWVHNKTVTVPLNYRPRKRPSQPIMPPSVAFFSSVKTCPEEWFQASAVLRTNEWSNLAPLQTHFFLPAVRVFALRDTIPFHIQLTGKLSSLKYLLSHLRTGDLPEQGFSNRTTDYSAITMSVAIHRQVSVKVNDQVAWQNSVIGTGKMRAVPPPFDSNLASGNFTSDSDGEPEESLDWEGELKINDSIRVGHFDAGNVAIKDFIIFSISGVSHFPTDFVALRNTVAIAVVTDPWAENNTLA